MLWRWLIRVFDIEHFLFNSGQVEIVDCGYLADLAYICINNYAFRHI